jgi:hypothetical protein
MVHSGESGLTPFSNIVLETGDERRRPLFRRKAGSTEPYHDVDWKNTPTTNPGRKDQANSHFIGVGRAGRGHSRLVD